MIKVYPIIFFVVAAGLAKAQTNVFTRNDQKNKKTINIKWYAEELISLQGYNVYRSVNGSEWEKLNQNPVKYAEYKISKSALQKDKELKGYVDMLSTQGNIKGLPLLAGIIKSFKSEELSKFLGIWYDDSTATDGLTYSYKVMKIVNGIEEPVGVSANIKKGINDPFGAPNGLEHKISRKSISFTWKPEPMRYFGTNVYRKDSTSSTYRRITRDPIILSKAKIKEGQEEYGKEFFVDLDLIPERTYSYFFEAINFFGDSSSPSTEINLTLKDLEPPSTPETLWTSVNGKKVKTCWKKQIKEADFVGYNIYLTSKNDTDYSKINTSLIDPGTNYYEYQSPRFGSFMYKIGVCDKNNNERLSNPQFIEIFDNEPPHQPTGLTVHSDTGLITLKWKENNEEDLLGYHVYRTVNKHSEDAYVKMTSNPIKENIFTEELPKNTKNKFLYKVVAVDESLNRSPYSEFAVGQMPDVIAPLTPFLKTINLSDKNHLVLEWMSNAEPDLLGYDVFRKNLIDSSIEVKKLNVNIINRLVTRFTDRDKEPGLFEYWIVAKDSSGNISSASNKLKFRVKETTTERKLIIDFSAQYNRRKKRVELKWNLDDESVMALVVYKIKPHETTFSPLCYVTERKQLIDADVNENEKYLYQIRAYDIHGNVIKSDKIELMIK